MNRIEKTFKKLKKESRKAFIPYIMSGDPNLEATERFVIELEECGADIIELGVPFTDPLADGPTIQRASERALKEGITLKKVIAFVEDIRQRIKIPLVLMTYYNPVFKYGNEAFVKEAGRVGVDGVIIPDLIPDEAGDFIKTAREYGLDTIFLLAPTSTEDRIKKVVRASTGFIYYVSITGITGARLSLEDSIMESINNIRNLTDKPVAIGFGVSTPEEAKAVSGLADGVIVGSAIVKRLNESHGDIKEYIQELRRAI